MIELETLLRTVPPIHQQRRITTGVHPELARFLDRQVGPDSVTLETGAGLSTLVILRKGVKRHIAIQPDPDQFTVIDRFLAEHGLDARPLEAVVRRSEDYLPTATLPPLDLVLIDGDHAFPIPFIDWHYTASALKVGGLMIVDDADIVTGAVLADFMRSDTGWEEVSRHESGRFAIARKLPPDPDAPRGWRRQRYLTEHYPTRAVRLLQRRTTPPGLVERALARTLPWRLVQQPLRRRFDWPRAE